MKIACVVVAKVNQYIVGLRGPYDNVTLPGGKLEEGETFLECASREFYEETGIKTHDLKFVWSSLNTDGYFVYVFKTKIDQINPEYVTKEGKVVLCTWRELLQSKYRAFYEILSCIT